MPTIVRARRRRVLYGVTAPNTALTFLRGQLGYLAQRGWDVHLGCPDNDAGDVARMADSEQATHHEISLSRDPSPLEDIRGLAQVIAIIRRVRPDVVVAGTPKMSLLLLLGSRVLGVPFRIYLCHGLRFEGYSGGPRYVLMALERLLVRLARKTVAVSPSVREGLLHIGVAPRRVMVLGPGSANGVDLRRFAVPSAGEVVAERRAFGLDHAAPVAAFVGRLTRDKGISTLLRCAQCLPNVRFLLAGSQEPSSRADVEVVNLLTRQENVRLLGRVSDVERVYRAADILLLPTRREGLPTVVLEAAAMGRPTVATRATGTVDAVSDGSTGLLTPQGDDEAFVSAVHELLVSDRARLDQMGRDAAARTRALFEPQKVWQRWADLLATVDEYSPDCHNFL